MNEVQPMDGPGRMRDTLQRTAHIRDPKIRLDVLDALEWANEAHSRTRGEWWPYFGLARIIARLRVQARRELRRVRR